MKEMDVIFTFSIQNMHQNGTLFQNVLKSKFFRSVIFAIILQPRHLERDLNVFKDFLKRRKAPMKNAIGHRFSL